MHVTFHVSGCILFFFWYSLPLSLCSFVCVQVFFCLSIGSTVIHPYDVMTHGQSTDALEGFKGHLQSALTFQLVYCFFQSICSYVFAVYVCVYETPVRCFICTGLIDLRIMMPRENLYLLANFKICVTLYISFYYLWVLTETSFDTMEVCRQGLRAEFGHLLMFESHHLYLGQLLSFLA